MTGKIHAKGFKWEYIWVNAGWLYNAMEKFSPDINQVHNTDGDK